MSTESPASSFTWRHVGVLVAVTLAIRVALLAIYYWGRHGNWSDFLAHSDAETFLRMGRVLVLGAPPDQLSFYDHRAFPGWPVLLGIATAIFPERLAAMTLTLTFAAAIPVLFYRITRSFHASLLFATVPPVWLLASTHPMAEPFFWITCLGALIAVADQRWSLAGIMGGLACVTKPYGVFLALGLAWASVAAGATERGRLRPVLQLFLASLVPVVAAGLLDYARFGTALPELAVYSAPLERLNLPSDKAHELGSAVGHWDWPFKALVTTPLRVPTPPWKIAYVATNLIAILVLTMRACFKLKRTMSRWEQACVVWLVGNTIASLCAGPYWGFHTFDRYIVWAWPAAAAVNRDLFSSAKWYAVFAPPSFVLAAFAMLHK